MLIGISTPFGQDYKDFQDLQDWNQTALVLIYVDRQQSKWFDQ
jgi:hypothetical protein